RQRHLLEGRQLTKRGERRREMGDRGRLVRRSASELDQRGEQRNTSQRGIRRPAAGFLSDVAVPAVVEHRARASPLERDWRLVPFRGETREHRKARTFQYQSDDVPTMRVARRLAQQ